jgi:hypothetical protein
VNAEQARETIIAGADLTFSQGRPLPMERDDVLAYAYERCEANGGGREWTTRPWRTSNTTVKNDGRTNGRES